MSDQAAPRVGAEMLDFIRELYPVCRSITGDGLRFTLEAVRERLDALVIHSVPSGTLVNDWEIPDEWNIRDAFIADVFGNRVVDFRDHNLHIVNYSVPKRARVPREELLRHLHTLPDQPDLIPYRTTYYNRSWGFCLQHDKLAELQDPEYDVCIDATLEAGALSYGELVLRGESNDEVLISTHVCHPSMANDNLSGLAVSVLLAEELSRRQRRRYTYRFVFVPGTIGAITWLAQNAETTGRIIGGLVVALVGAPGKFHYKASFGGDERIDRVARRTLRELGADYVDIPFSPYGYDERQYSSPGYRMPMGSLTRTPHGEFPQYHTSADNLDFIDGETLSESLYAYTSIVEALERERILVNRFPYGEPQLGRRGLYDSVGGIRSDEGRKAMLWILSLSDGRHSIDDIADRSGIDVDAIAEVAGRLLAEGVVTER